MTAWPVADVYIASLGRSGSTLFANLVTTPPDRLVVVEPMLHADGDPDRNLDLYRRSCERDRNRGAVSAAGVGRHARAGAVAEVARVGEMLIDYQRRYGYAS